MADIPAFPELVSLVDERSAALRRWAATARAGGDPLLAEQLNQFWTGTGWEDVSRVLFSYVCLRLSNCREQLILRSR